MSADGRVIGHGGCNRFFGGYRMDGEGLLFSAPGSTKMSCPGDTGLLERAFFDAFGSAGRFRLSWGTLELFGGAGLLARFRAISTPRSDMALRF